MLLNIESTSQFGVSHIFVDRAVEEEETFKSVCFRPKRPGLAAASPGQLISPSDRFYHRGCAHQFRHRFNPPSLWGPHLAPMIYALGPPQCINLWPNGQKKVAVCEAGERARQLLCAARVCQRSWGLVAAPADKELRAGDLASAVKVIPPV